MKSWRKVCVELNPWPWVRAERSWHEEQKHSDYAIFWNLLEFFFVIFHSNKFSNPSYTYALTCLCFMFPLDTFSNPKFINPNETRRRDSRFNQKQKQRNLIKTVRWGSNPIGNRRKTEIALYYCPIINRNQKDKYLRFCFQLRNSTEHSQHSVMNKEF